MLTPFLVHAEIDTLRTLSQFVLDWVKQEHERIASQLVQDFNVLPLNYRAAAPSSFVINVQPKDHFAPKSEP
jgi:hypothetical protein